MFELPETKRVRRTKLFKASPPPPDTSNAALHLDLDFDFITVAAPSPNSHPPPKQAEVEVDFQLFSTTQHKITLKDPTPPPTSEDVWEQHARQQQRPASYYVLSEADMAARRQTLRFADAVVSAEEVVKGAGVRWPGCYVPWKVTTITAAAASTPRGKGVGKPGKKKRVYLRKVEQKKRVLEEARLKIVEGRKKFAGLPKEEREAKEREERSRRNREKKVKRRIREKAKKEAARAAGGDMREGSESESESGCEDEKLKE